MERAEKQWKEMTLSEKIKALGIPPDSRQGFRQVLKLCNPEEGQKPSEDDFKQCQKYLFENFNYCADNKFTLSMMDEIIKNPQFFTAEWLPNLKKLYHHVSRPIVVLRAMAQAYEKHDHLGKLDEEWGSYLTDEFENFFRNYRSTEKDKLDPMMCVYVGEILAHNLHLIRKENAKEWRERVNWYIANVATIYQGNQKMMEEFRSNLYKISAHIKQLDFSKGSDMHPKSSLEIKKENPKNQKMKNSLQSNQDSIEEHQNHFDYEFPDSDDEGEKSVSGK